MNEAQEIQLQINAIEIMQKYASGEGTMSVKTLEQMKSAITVGHQRLIQFIDAEIEEQKISIKGTQKK